MKFLVAFLSDNNRWSVARLTRLVGYDTSQFVRQCPTRISPSVFVSRSWVGPPQFFCYLVMKDQELKEYTFKRLQSEAPILLRYFTLLIGQLGSLES
jgi:hypothetical protein